MSAMNAIVVYEAGGAEVLKVEDRRIPRPPAGEILIRGWTRCAERSRAGLFA